MIDYFNLEPKEKRQEWILLITAILFFLTILTGVYYQYHHNASHDVVLTPLFFLLGSCFFGVYSTNAFKNGNLVQKWTPAYIFDSLLFLKQKIHATNKEGAKSFVTKLLGVFGLLIAAALFITAILGTKGWL